MKNTPPPDIQDLGYMSKRAGLGQKARQLLGILMKSPLQNPPPHEKLVGDMAGSDSRRINLQHRLVYEVGKEQGVVYVLMTGSRFGGLIAGTLLLDLYEGKTEPLMSIKGFYWRQKHRIEVFACSRPYMRSFPISPPL